MKDSLDVMLDLAWRRFSDVWRDKRENIRLVEGKFVGTVKIRGHEVPVEINIDFRKLPWKGLPFKLGED